MMLEFAEGEDKMSSVMRVERYYDEIQEVDGGTSNFKGKLKSRVE